MAAERVGVEGGGGVPHQEGIEGMLTMGSHERAPQGSLEVAHRKRMREVEEFRGLRRLRPHQLAPPVKRRGGTT